MGRVWPHVVPPGPHVVPCAHGNGCGWMLRAPDQSFRHPRTSLDPCAITARATRATESTKVLRIAWLLRSLFFSLRFFALQRQGKYSTCFLYHVYVYLQFRLHCNCICSCGAPYALRIQPEWAWWKTCSQRYLTLTVKPARSCLVVTSYIVENASIILEHDKTTNSVDVHVPH